MTDNLTQENSSLKEPNVRFLENIVIKECEKPVWLMLRVPFPGQEQRALDNLQRQAERYGLQDKVVEICTPKEHVVTLENNTTVHKQQHFYPGYVFVAFDIVVDTEIHDLASLFLRDKRILCRVSLAEISRIKQLAMKSSQIPTTAMTLHKGQHVRVIAGSYLNMTGAIEKIDFEQKKVMVKLEIFGREVAVELDMTQVSAEQE